MREEVAAAVVLVSRIVKKNQRLSKEKVEEFSGQLTKVLVERFKNHWYAEKPHRGQGYRCIRVNGNERVDPALCQAASDSGLSYSALSLPLEFTLWVDPHEVSCRFSELKGHCYTVASFRDGKTENKALTLDIEELMEDQLNRNESFKAQRLNSPSADSLDNSQFYINTTFDLHTYYPNGFYADHHHNYEESYADQVYSEMNYLQEPGVHEPSYQPPAYPPYKHSHVHPHPHAKKVPKKPMPMGPHAGLSKPDRFHWVRAGNLVKA